jgi:cytochrome c55X
MAWKKIWLIWASVTALALTPAMAAMAARISAERGRELVYLVRQDCGSCHGMTLKGGLGKPLQPTDIKETPAEVLAAIILDGVPDTPMPPWRGLLSEDEALWIARALKKGLPE